MHTLIYKRFISFYHEATVCLYDQSSQPGLITMQHLRAYGLSNDLGGMINTYVNFNLSQVFYSFNFCNVFLFQPYTTKFCKIIVF